MPAQHVGHCAEGCACLRATTPFFRTEAGDAIRTRHVANALKAMAPLVGLDPDLLGGKSLRIAYATDAFDVLGPQGAEHHIRDLGRWHSEIWTVYARISAQVLMHTSEEIETSRGVSLEELAEGWIQSAAPRR